MTDSEKIEAYNKTIEALEKLPTQAEHDMYGYDN